MSSHLADRDQGLRAEDQRAGLRLPRRAGVRRRGRRQERHAVDHGRRRREAVFERVKPLFELMGKNITLVGGNGDGQTAKVANQIIVALNIEAVAEALLFAAKAGADPARVRQALMGGFASSQDPRSARRAHDQAHLRSGLSHRAAPEGPEPGAVQRARARRLAAEHRHRAGTVQLPARPMAARPGTTRRWCARWRSWPTSRSASRPEGTALHRVQRDLAARRAQRCIAGSRRSAGATPVSPSSSIATWVQTARHSVATRSLCSR